MQNLNRFHRLLSSTSIATFALLGCAEKSEVEDTCTWLESRSECKNSDDSADEVGDGDGDEDPLVEDDEDYDAPKLDRDVCLTEPNGHTKTVHQCQGGLSISVEFDTFLGNCAETLGSASLCEELILFGPSQDSYAAPAVMACCDPLPADDPDYELEKDSYLQYCVADSIEQLCRSLPLRLQKYIDDGLFLFGKGQAKRLQAWLSRQENLESCYAALYDRSDELGVIEPREWLVNDGDNGEWGLLENFTIKLDLARVNHVALPEDPQDWLECVDNNFNNTEIFEQVIPGPPGLVGATNLASPASVTVVGPELLGAPILGGGRILPSQGPCESCSRMELIADGSSPDWALTELELVSYGPVRLGNADFALDIERAAIRLYALAPGILARETEGPLVHLIPAHRAGFVVSGVSHGVADLRWATNATPIVLYPTDRGWRMEAFELEHIDRNQDRWSIQLPSMIWE